jgi:hypothetical protein
MITDVSGFTRHREAVVRDSGQAGAERIGHVLNDFSIETYRHSGEAGRRDPEL